MLARLVSRPNIKTTLGQRLVSSINSGRRESVYKFAEQSQKAVAAHY